MNLLHSIQSFQCSRLQIFYHGAFQRLENEFLHRKIQEHKIERMLSFLSVYICLNYNYDYDFNLPAVQYIITESYRYFQLENSSKKVRALIG